MKTNELKENITNLNNKLLVIKLKIDEIERRQFREMKDIWTMLNNVTERLDKVLK